MLSLPLKMWPLISVMWRSCIHSFCNLLIHFLDSHGLISASEFYTVSYSGAAWEALVGLIWTVPPLPPVFPPLPEASRSPTPSSDLVGSLQCKLSALLSLCLESRVCRAEVSVVTLQSGTVQYCLQSMAVAKLRFFWADQCTVDTSTILVCRSRAERARRSDLAALSWKSRTTGGQVVKSPQRHPLHHLDRPLDNCSDDREDDDDPHSLI